MAARRRRMVTRSVSANQPHAPSSPEPEAEPTVEETAGDEVLAVEQPEPQQPQDPSPPSPPSIPIPPSESLPSQDIVPPSPSPPPPAAHDPEPAPNRVRQRLLDLPPVHKKRPSTTNLDEIDGAMVGGSGRKRVKSETVPLDDQVDNTRPELVVVVPKEDSSTGEPMSGVEEHPDAKGDGAMDMTLEPNVLKRTRADDDSMDVDEHAADQPREDEPRKRRAVSDEGHDSTPRLSAPTPELAWEPFTNTHLPPQVKPRSLLDPHPTPKTPFLDLRSTPKLPKSRSQPIPMPTQFTPVASKLSTSQTLRRLSLDASTAAAAAAVGAYYDVIIPVKGEDEDEKTPKMRRGSPAPAVLASVNPFMEKGKAREEEEAEERPKRHQSEPPSPQRSGDKFGPAVPSLKELLGKAEAPTKLTDSVIRRGGAIEEQEQVEENASPTKQVLPSTKVKPSMIPRLVLAPPPPPSAKKSAPGINSKQVSPAKKRALNKTLASLSPVKSFARFFASPAKGSSSNAGGLGSRIGKSGLSGSIFPRKAAASSKLSASVTTATDGDVLKRSTNLSEEAQASLAKMSLALEKLAAPRPRNSASSSEEGSATIAGGSSSSSTPEGKGKGKRKAAEGDMEVDELVVTGPSKSSPRSERVRSLRARAEKEKLAKGKGKAVAKDQDDEWEDDDDEQDVATSTTPKNKGKAKDSSPSTAEPVEIVSDCLQGCVIFVDVRTEEGADASAMFVQMLKGLSAKVISRPGTTATHYVWKTGSQATLARYSTLEEPKPFLVGIGWVVQCVEKKERVDEKKYLVNVKEAEILFGAKRRRSLQVKDRSSLIGGGLTVSTLHKPTAAAKARTVSNPVTQSARPAVKKPLPKAGNTITRYFGKPKGKEVPKPAPAFKTKLMQAPPTPVREEPEPSEDAEPGPSSSRPKVVQEDDAMDLDQDDNEPPPPPQLLREKTPPPPPPEAITKPSIPIARPAPAAVAKPLAPKMFVTKSSNLARKSAAPAPASGLLDGLEELLADTKTSLLEEAQKRNLQSDPVNRAKRKPMMFAPKVSSPLKRNVSSGNLKEVG